MPLYEDLVRRALDAHERSQELSLEGMRIQKLAQVLREAREDDVMLLRCAWCGSYRVGEEWLQLRAIGRGQMQITRDLLDRASHGICVECLQRELQRSEEHHRLPKGALSASSPGVS